MAKQAGDDVDWEDEENANYKAPEKKTLDELKNLDTEDESLRRYKEALLGAAVSAIEPPCSLAQLKANPIQIHEGSTYRIKVSYYVQRDIVSGLRYKQTTTRGPLRVDQVSVMLGSYRPQREAHVWMSEAEEAPKGVMSRGTYHCRSKFTDDDKNDYITWDWYISVIKSPTSSDS